MNRTLHRDLPPGLVLIGLGSWALWETLTMSVLGAVFPRLAGSGMLVGGVILCIRALWRAPPVQPPEGELTRPLLFLALLLGWAVMLPITGFVLTSVCAALLAMFLSADEKFDAKTAAIQAISLAALVGVAALLFGQILMVNLP
ncbi:tripartite tricarboxylate transporter TctB family protein [Litoreibacter roseus]|uniref:DUF1468 domain-containing protein n=1 Tax=Litoreibacter roseus TaxID=2601869 RepID=A0A6N6JMD7_9RHOB|nr:tripartite tricarboxylate transporter TctB family protein [Litoreibacter roseus]GFE67050.1 hypothetical protein KIN_41240 [Litoreibacter roseus]